MDLQASQNSLDEESILIPSDTQLLVHGADGDYLMEKDKWPKLLLASEVQDSEPIESLTQEGVLFSENQIGFTTETLTTVPGSEEMISQTAPKEVTIVEEDMAVCSVGWFVKKYCWLVCVREKYCSGWKFTIVYDKPQPNEQAYIDEVGQGWQASKGRKTKRLKKTQIVMASRTCSRIPRDGIPIAEKASMRATARDNISDIIIKDFEEWNETLQAKCRRTLQFSPENVEMTRPMTEGGFLKVFQVMDSSGTNSLLKSDGTDELPEEWLVNCLQVVEACFPAEEMNTHVAAMEKAVDISAHQNTLPCQQSIVVHKEPAQARPALLKAGKTIVTRKEPRTYVAYPFDFVLPSSIRRGVTIKDINEMIKAKPPLKIKHKNDEEPNSFQALAIFGKPVVHKRRIHALPPHKIKHGND
ncbi:uncharacterized protein [Miscanthus floridulus]|uniref:uncharacterized protein isoform X2 n=1 Tax=Miscanthus floridulus TaxID=154761 RepID=UPI00345881F5